MGNAIGNIAVLNSLNILLILLLLSLLLLLLLATVSYYRKDKEVVLKVACCILMGDCIIDLYRRKEEVSVKARKQKRGMRTDFERTALEEYSR